MKQLTVQFIDEEAIFPCMEDMTKKWRRIFMMMGAKFEWYCVEVKHFNCFNALSNDETVYMLGLNKTGCVGKTATSIFD